MCLTLFDTMRCVNVQHQFHSKSLKYVHQWSDSHLFIWWTSSCIQMKFAIFWPNVSQCPYPVFRTGFFYFTCCVIVFCEWNYRFQKVYIITVIDCLFVSLCLCFVKINCHLLTHWLKVSSKTKKDNIPKWMHFRKSSKGVGGSFLILKITWQTLDLYTGL